MIKPIKDIRQYNDWDDKESQWTTMIKMKKDKRQCYDRDDETQQRV